jgi:hypothetical protein
MQKTGKKEKQWHEISESKSELQTCQNPVPSKRQGLHLIVPGQA